ncbi:hypothetical protein AVEN_143939-1 [Araneus ventricosus]|uniref:Uncharacterized protein n=1 Tax=Araneus ventricosus TaxID=182803 RepID=A0A4Y2QJW6_ARAVE|nr:hypothetical protein AVEN_143939-1 [Araneus ventricosus]
MSYMTICMGVERKYETFIADTEDENSGSNGLTESEGFESSSIKTTITRERSAEFLIDSAATTHICNQKNWFSNLKQIYPTEVLVSERDSSAKAVATTKHPDTSLSSDSGSRSEESSNSDEVYETLEYECYNSELPRTLEDTQRSKEKENWDIAMKEELKIMETHRVWELVNSPADETIIGSKWDYNIKFDDSNKPKKYNARLVALGFKQKDGIDYGETFSPTVNFLL